MGKAFGMSEGNSADAVEPVEKPELFSKNVRRGILLVWVTYSVALLMMSLVPGHSVPSPMLLGWDKLAHAVAYFVLGTVTAASLMNRRNWLVLTVVYGCAMGLISELQQSFAPGRDASIADMVANAIGIAAAVVVAFVWARYARRAR